MSASRNLLVTYIEEFYIWEGGRTVRHNDPTFETEWSYCTGNRRLLKCSRGNYVFFHTTKIDTTIKQKQRYITAYFVIKDVGLGRDVVPKYNLRGGAKHALNIEEHCVIVGDEKLSKKLKAPGLGFDRSLAERLMFDPPKRIRFDIRNRHGRNLSELECISSATRNIRTLSDEDVDILLREIGRSRL